MNEAEAVARLKGNYTGAHSFLGFFCGKDTGRVCVCAAAPSQPEQSASSPFSCVFHHFIGALSTKITHTPSGQFFAVVPSFFAPEVNFLAKRVCVQPMINSIQGQP
ncbi:MAG: hypothetical protein WBE68_01460 [Candidatus Nitrosopolaris sp.]